MNDATHTRADRAPSHARPFRYEWDGTVRRLKLPPLVKLVAAYVSQYADNDGRNTRPGVERLALETQTSPATVKRALKKLRELGLLVLVRSGSAMGRRAQANEYRLAIPEDLLERVELVTEINVGTPDHSSPEILDPAAEDVPETPEQGSAVIRDLTEQGSVATGTGLTCDPPPNQKTTPADNTTPDNYLRPAEPLTPREGEPPANPKIHNPPNCTSECTFCRSKGGRVVIPFRARRAS